MAVSNVFAEKVNARLDANSTALVYFATEGDVYADGSPVKDGEWYVFCWSKNAKFGGLNLDCTAVDDEDLVLHAAPIAEGGGCPLFMFSGKNVNSGGHYFVYVLDTRTPDRTALAQVIPCDGNDSFPEGRPAFVNGISEAENASISVVGSTWIESSANNVDPFSQARISEIKVDDANGLVDLTVVGMMPNVQYNVQMGQQIEGVGGAALQKTYAVKIPKTDAEKDSDGKVYFRIPKEEAKFFKVVRQPLDLPVDAE